MSEFVTVNRSKPAKKKKKNPTFFKCHTTKEHILLRERELLLSPPVKLASFSTAINLAIIHSQTYSPHKLMLSISTGKGKFNNLTADLFGKCRQKVYKAKQSEVQREHGAVSHLYGDSTDSANYQTERKAHFGTTQPLGYDMITLILYSPFNLECAIMSGIIFQCAEVNCLIYVYPADCMPPKLHTPLKY